MPTPKLISFQNYKLDKIERQTAPQRNTAQQLSNEWLHLRVLSIVKGLVNTILFAQAQVETLLVSCMLSPLTSKSMEGHIINFVLCYSAYSYPNRSWQVIFLLIRLSIVYICITLFSFITLIWDT